jgi:acetyl-CoA C-acetyltransferase
MSVGHPAAARLADVTRTVIVAAVRTPFGKLGGGLKGYEATGLGAIAIRAALERAGLEGAEVDYVIMGQVLQGGAGQAPARQAAVGAGIPIGVPADTINKVCASSLRAVEIADSMIRAGDAELVVTGGMESMSNAPYVLKQARFGYRLGDGSLIDLMTHDGLTSSFDGRHMVEQASFVSRELGIPREQQDRWALRSHERAAAAQDAGRLDDEIVPVDDVAADESVRRDTTYEKLASLKPVFDPEGTTTAGNAPGVNDGASCVIVCSDAFAKRRGLEPLATVLAQGYVADEFAYLARTPAKAGAQALTRAGKAIGDVKRVEINEAFASVALNSTALLGADPELVNVNGGAVALGHPIGASGGRILGTMVHELRREGGGLGLAAICSGGGQGDALLIEV